MTAPTGIFRLNLVPNSETVSGSDSSQTGGLSTVDCVVVGLFAEQLLSLSHATTSNSYVASTVKPSILNLMSPLVLLQLFTQPLASNVE